MSTAFTNLQAVPIDSALPPQNTGTSGKALVSNGTNVGWNTILSMIGQGSGQTPGADVAAAILPAQSGNSGKYLTTNGNGTLTWEIVTTPTTAGVSSITISGTQYTGDVTISNVPSANSATNVTGVVAITNGGTGATTASQALTNLGAAAANHTHNYAPLVSPAFTGAPTAPTAVAGTNTTQLATTAFVTTNFLAKTGGTLTDTTDATSKDTGSLILEGGLGVEKSIYSGGSITAEGGIKFADGTTQNTATVGASPSDISYVSNSGTNAFMLVADKRVYTTQAHGGFDNYSSGSAAQNASGIRTMDHISEIAIPGETSPIAKAYVSFSVNWALTESGKLYVWGYNGYGQLGLGHNNNVSVPTLSATGVVEVYYDDAATIGYNTQYTKMVIKKNDGYIYVTGYNGFGQLGLGDTTDRNTWTVLTDAGQNPLYVGNLGLYVGCLVVQKADKSIWVAGYNGYGQLGTGTTVQQNSLVNVSNVWTGGNPNLIVKKVVGGFGYSTDVSASNSAICMWLSDGTTDHVRTCGNNTWSQLGNGDTAQQTTPVLVVSATGTARIRQLEWTGDGVGGVMYVDNNNDLWAWGYNNYGQLGNGTTTNIASPTKVRTDTQRILLTRASITYGHYLSTFIEDTGGVVWSTGYNGHGELGVGDTTNRSSWTRVRLPQGVAIKSMGNWASMGTGNINVAVTTTNSVYAWGYNGQYGIFYPSYGDVCVPLLINMKLVR